MVTPLSCPPALSQPELWCSTALPSAVLPQTWGSTCSEAGGTTLEKRLWWGFSSAGVSQSCWSHMTAVSWNEDLPSDVQGTAARAELPQVGPNPAAPQMQQPGVQGWFTDIALDTKGKCKQEYTAQFSCSYFSHTFSRLCPHLNLFPH